MTTAIDMAPRAEAERVGGGQGRRPSLAYRLLLVLILAILGGLALQAAGARLLARQSPDLALQISPNDAIALSRRASGLMLQATRDGRQLASARRFAERAIRRDLTRDDALFVLGATINTKDGARTRRIVGHAETLSRRNFLTQLWLIEDAVQRGSVGGALRHFDTALRTTESAGGVLYPVLRGAVDDPELTMAIARTVNAAPWRGQFLQYAVSLNRPTPALAQLFARQRGLTPFQGTDLKAALIGQLVANRLYDDAAGLALKKGSGLVNDPRFGGDRGYPPFSWQLSDAAGIVAQRVRDPGGARLEVTADEGAGGVAAAQLIRAPAGPHVLRADATGAATGLFASLICADDKRELGSVPLGRSISAAITIPAGCQYQLLSIVVSSGTGRSSEWQITNIDLVPN